MTDHFSFSDYIFNMKDYDHISISYTMLQQLDEIIRNFFLRGMQHNQVNFWIVNQNVKKQWLEVLKRNEIDVNHLIDSKELIIIDPDEIFSNVSSDPSFNPIMEKLQTFKNVLVNGKKTGINAIGTLASQQESDYINIEKYWHDAMKSFEYPITLLSPYYFSSIKQSPDSRFHICGLIRFTENFMTPSRQSESENLPKKELAMLTCLNEIIITLRNVENFEQITNLVRMSNSNGNKTIPKWYFNFVDALSELYDKGRGNNRDECESMR